MKVKELIEQLQKMPPDSNVMYAWDGEARSNADLVFLSRSGIVIIAEYDEPIYSTEYRPEGVLTET